MPGITNLSELLRSMRPTLIKKDVVFCTVPGDVRNFYDLNPLATFIEPEGLTLVLGKSEAERAGLPFESIFNQITLTVHSSLDAVGLTAAVAEKLASKGISANVIAAYYHDHIFVPASNSEAALLALEEFNE